MEAAQPAMVGFTAGIRLTQLDHGGLLDVQTILFRHTLELGNRALNLLNPTLIL